MPELPEVETIRQGAIQKLKDKEIKNIEIRVPKIFIGDVKNVIGAETIDFRRVGKILEVVLDNGYSILIHLKLTGQLVYVPAGAAQRALPGGHFQRVYDQPLPHAHTHIIYTFSDGSHLYFNDLRKFGWNKVIKSNEAIRLLGSDKFGPEPCSKNFTAQYLKNIFSKSQKPIKLILMDQQKIAGLGNIYANDALYWAEILPTRPAKLLSDDEINKLKSAIEKVIKLGLKYGGSSENTYVNIEGKRGRYMDVAAVYAQKIDPQGHQIKKIQLGGRGTFFCSICQK